MRIGILRKSFQFSDIQDFREFRSWPRSQGHSVRGCCYGQSLPEFQGTLIEAEPIVSLDKAGACEVKHNLSGDPQRWLCIPMAIRA